MTITTPPLPFDQSTNSASLRHIAARPYPSGATCGLFWSACARSVRTRLPCGARCGLSPAMTRQETTLTASRLDCVNGTGWSGGLPGRHARCGSTGTTWRGQRRDYTPDS